MNISLVIPTFNRTDFVIDSFIRVLNNEVIDEIIIVDDSSNYEVYAKLFILVNDLQNKKVKVFRNKKNLGPLLNKYEAVKRSSNDWCILLDSDNIIGSDYVKIIEGLKKEDDVLYCPEVLWREVDKKKIAFNYDKFRKLIISKNNAKNYIGTELFETWLNTGNYFFNKNAYLKVIEENKLEDQLMINDAIYFSYLWLLSGNRMKIVPELMYIHRVHKGSWYKRNKHVCSRISMAVRKKLKILC